MYNYVSYDSTKKEIIISGISIARLKNRIADTYSSSGVNPINGSKYLKIFNKMDYINWENTEITFYSFFALEIYELFSDLYQKYNDTKYADVAEELYRKTWISNFEKREAIKIDTVPLLLFKPEYKLKDYQLEFVKQYPTNKFKYDLNGYILSFEQGLGKTLTSLALAECLKKEVIYIICPNSIKEVWAREIQKYYIHYNLDVDQSLWHSEVSIIGNDKFMPTKKTKFFIINNESIQKLFPYVNPMKNSMIIIDESQNFRGMETKRVGNILKLKELSNCDDCLLMSGTPIKATANELVPALQLIDPHFTPELAKMYNKLFSTSSSAVSVLLRPRFKRVIYRKMKRDVKDAVSLPEKFVSDIKFKIPRPERFSTTKCFNEILNSFHIEYLNKLKNGIFTNNKQSPYYRNNAGNYNFLDEKITFENVVRKYSRAKKEITEEYLKKIFQETEDHLNYKLINSRNVDDEYFKFLNRFVLPFVPQEEKQYVSTKFNGIFGWSIAAKSATGTAIGKVTSKYKNECFKEIWQYNSKEIISMIQKNNKKTIIYSTMIPIVELISESLNKQGIDNIKITGSGSNRMSLIDEFKNNPDIKVLVATTQTLAVGVTLTEANQVIFFGTPYRSTDFEQACDRVHRIGQIDSVYIYNVLLYSQEKNVTGRIEEILNWSGEMFDSLINESKEFI